MSVVGQLYRIIIDDVIKNVKAEVAAEGLDDTVLQELQQTWEVKLQQSGAVNLAMGDGVADYGQHAAYPYDLNNYNANAFLQTSFPDLTHNTLYNMNNQAYLPAPEMAAAPRPYPSSAASTQLAATALRSLNANSPYDGLGKPQQYMPAPAWNNAPVNVNLGDRSGASSASIQNILRQHDGASDQPQEELQASKSEETKQIDEMILHKYEEIVKKKAEMQQKKKKTKTIPQLDGKSGDSEDEDESDGDVGDEELDSDLDDDDDTEPETENFVLCQYEKVTRIKNKRKTNLKDGIMHLNGRDSVFHKATGEFDW